MQKRCDVEVAWMRFERQIGEPEAENRAAAAAVLSATAAGARRSGTTRCSQIRKPQFKTTAER